MERIVSLLLIIVTITEIYGQKTAYIDYEKIYKMLPIYKKKQTTIDSIKISLEKDITLKKTKNTTRYTELINKYNPSINEPLENVMQRMTNADLILLDAIRKEEVEIENRISRYNDKVSQLDYIELKPIENWINIEIAKYCQNNHIDLLYSLNESNNLVYFSKQLDITDDFIEKTKNKINIIGKDNSLTSLEKK